MSAETRQLAERLLAAFCGDERDVVAEIISEDHVFVPAGEQAVQGGRGFARWFRDINEVMPMRYDDPGAIDCGPAKALGVLNTHYRSATGGVGSVQRMWFVFTLKDGKIVRTEAYTDPDAALEAGKS